MTGRKASLPGLPAVTESNLLPVVRALAERSEVREGGRGDALETAVTLRDIQDLKAANTYLTDPNKVVGPNDAVISLGGGLTATIAIEKFVDAIKGSKLFKDLQYRLDNPERFSTLPTEVRKLVEGSIAEKAAELGAAITRVENKSQSALTSLATVVDEVTAAVDGAAAGVRQVTYAYAQADAAQAGTITQVQARLNGTRIDKAAINQTVYPNLSALYAGVTQPQPGAYYQIAGTPRTLWAYDFGAKVFTQRGTINADGSGTTTISATLEQTMAASVDRITGAEAKYTVKINAGGAIAGFGLLAADNNGRTESAFIVQAEKFAIVGPNYNTGLTNTPNLATVPFGVDGNGIYMNTSVYLKGTMKIDGLNSTNRVLGSGLRGSVTAAVAHPNLDWDDNYARIGVYQVIGKAGDTTNSWLVTGDTVTITNSATGKVTTKQYTDSSGWINAAVTINGALIVNGTIDAPKIDTRNLTIKDASGNVIFGSGVNLNVGRITGLGALATKNASDTVDVGGQIIPATSLCSTLRKISSGTIQNFMDTSAITTAYIGEAQVDTLRIGLDQVTVPFFASLPNGSYGNTSNPLAPTLATSKQQVVTGIKTIVIATYTSEKVGSFAAFNIFIYARRYRKTAPSTIFASYYLGGSGASFQNYANGVVSGSLLVGADWDGDFFDIVACVGGEAGVTCTSANITAIGGRR